MTWTKPENFDDKPPKAPSAWTLKFKDAFWPAPPLVYKDETGASAIIPLEQRKSKMSSMDGRETRFSFIGFLLAAIFGLVLPIYYIVKHVETKTGKHQVSVGPDALLLGGAVLLFAVVGFIVLWKRRRTMVAFLLFLVGLGVGYSILFIGFVFIVLGGWLMLNAWRIHRYGTADAKLIRQEAANRPRGREARAAAPRSKAAGTSSSGSGTRKAPTASKRYTPKAPPRKKIPKPTQ